MRRGEFILSHLYRYHRQTKPRRRGGSRRGRSDLEGREREEKKKKESREKE